MASSTTIVANIRILVDKNCYVDFINPCVANSKISGFTPDLTQELVLKEILQNSRATVYRGTLDGTPVIAKVSFGNDMAKLGLWKEVNNYFALEDLQGTVIPRCYNYVEGSTPIKRQTKPSEIAYLILEDCGKSVGDLFLLKLKKKYAYSISF